MTAFLGYIPPFGSPDERGAVTLPLPTGASPAPAGGPPASHVFVVPWSASQVRELSAAVSQPLVHTVEFGDGGFQLECLLTAVLENPSVRRLGLGPGTSYVSSPMYIKSLIERRVKCACGAVRGAMPSDNIARNCAGCDREPPYARLRQLRLSTGNDFEDVSSIVQQTLTLFPRLRVLELVFAHEVTDIAGPALDRLADCVRGSPLLAVGVSCRTGLFFAGGLARAAEYGGPAAQVVGGLTELRAALNEADGHAARGRPVALRLYAVRGLVRVPEEAQNHILSYLTSARLLAPPPTAACDSPRGGGDDGAELPPTPADSEYDGNLCELFEEFPDTPPQVGGTAPLAADGAESSDVHSCGSGAPAPQPASPAAARWASSAATAPAGRGAGGGSASAASAHAEALTLCGGGGDNGRGGWRPHRPLCRDTAPPQRLGGRVLAEEATRLHAAYKGPKASKVRVKGILAQHRKHAKSGDVHFHVTFFLIGEKLTKREVQDMRSSYRHSLTSQQRKTTFPTVVPPQ